MSRIDAPGIRVLKKRRMNQPFTKYLVYNLRGTGTGDSARVLAWRCLSVWNQPELLSPLVDVPTVGTGPANGCLRSPTLVVRGVWISEDTQSKIGNGIMIVGADTLRR
jgi:hypothetical protein